MLYSSIICFLLFFIPVKTEKQYDIEYTDLLKDRCKITASFPNDLLEYSSTNSTQYFTFDELQSLPRFYYGPIINLTENCHIVLMDITNQRQAHYDIGQLITNFYPDAVGWMLKNCSLPWEYWFYTPPGGLPGNLDIQNADNTHLKRHTEQERIEMMNKAMSLRREYEEEIESGDLIEKTNCSVVSIVRIPNIKQINSTDESLCNRLKINSTECYGVEFYKRATHTGFKMLFFINNNGNMTINDYVIMVSQYIVFD